MRTAFFVMILVVMALAAGGSFIVHAQDGAPAATLDEQCLPAVLPSGVDTLVSCTFTAHNSGAVALANARLSIGAKPDAQIPDSYYFFRASRNGVGQPISEGTLTYDYGDIAPGVSSTLALDIIVRTAHPYAATAQLAAGDTGDVLATADLGADVGGASTSPIAVTLKRVGDAFVTTSARFELQVRNNSGAAVHNLTVELDRGESATLSPAVGWAPGDAPHHETYAIDNLAAGQSAAQTLTFVANDLPCPFVHPAVVVTAESDTGPVTAAAIAEGSASLGDCDGQGGGGVSLPNPQATLLDLPTTGSGPARGANPHERTLGLGLAVGLLLIAAGFSVRRAHRR